MSRLEFYSTSGSQAVVESLYRDLEHRIVASPPGLCPVDLAASFLKLCHAQTCGKCVPCRVGLRQLELLMNDVLNGTATMDTLAEIERTAQVISDSADCAIGYEAAGMVLKGIRGFRDDYESHVKTGRCLCNLDQPVPCVAQCPAGVDIPGYIALIGAGRYADAVRLIRKDNPFPGACGLVCEHPCEARCRRNMIEGAVNIRGLKRYAVDHAGIVPPPECAEATGKTVAVVGGGPSGLSAAFYLSLMGHQVTVFESRKQLGGMLRYGIPSYRLPRQELQKDIDAILATGVKVELGVTIGKDISLAELHRKFDAIYISIGAHTDKKVGIEGEDSRGVMSAVEMLRAIGDGTMPDFTGKRVAVIGGGNVAMDCTRSAIRLGAETVSVVYRRRQQDMTALADEVEGALAEGAELLTMMAPLRIEADSEDNAVALWVQPQRVGAIDKAGRPRPENADQPPVRVEADVIIVAIGQSIELKAFEEYGVPIHRGTIAALSSGGIENNQGIFAGGDCVTGPATVIKAIAAGKVAAANIDEYLGYSHTITVDVKIPKAYLGERPSCGRSELPMEKAYERKGNFQCIECGFTEEVAKQEAQRCLRCDHFGYGVFKGGRKKKW